MINWLRSAQGSPSSSKCPLCGGKCKLGQADHFWCHLCGRFTIDSRVMMYIDTLEGATRALVLEALRQHVKALSRSVEVPRIRAEDVTAARSRF
jgi:hypothetical protein